MEEKYKVTVNLYDLSQGMARQFSQNLIGKQIDGIWHTGIVVYGVEYFFGGGICTGIPKQTPYGSPVREIDMGFTEIPKELFHEFLQDISPRFSMETYDLFNNNCNNFTEECANFLVGSSIPSYITGLPQEVLKTPLGQMMQPMIQRMQQQISSGGSQMFPQMCAANAGPQTNATNTSSSNSKPQSNLPNQMGFQNPLLNRMQGQFGAPGGFQAPGGLDLANFDYNSILQNLQGNLGGPQQQNPSSGHSEKIMDIRNMADFQDVAQRYKGVVLDFYSTTCPPCQNIKPHYARLAEQYSVSHPHLKFCMVNGGIAGDVMRSFQVKQFPTFKFFFENKEIESFAGAYVEKLRNSVDNLARKVEQALLAGGVSVGTKSADLQQASSAPTFNIYNPSIQELLFYKAEKFDQAISKINSLKDMDKAVGYGKYKAFADNQTEAIKSFSFEDRSELFGFLLSNLTALDQTNSVPFLDILSGLVGTAEFCETLFLTQSKEADRLFSFLLNNMKTILRPIRVLLLRLTVNFFSHRKGKEFIAREMDRVRTLIGNWESFQEDKTSIRSIIYLCYNIVILGKNFKIEGELEIEFLQRLLKILEVEKEDQNFLSLIIAIIHLVYKNEKLINWMKEQHCCKIFDRPKASKDEKVVFAARDLHMIFSGKI